jgi:hypothetical protein
MVDELPHPRVCSDSQPFEVSDTWFACGRRPRNTQGWKLYIPLTVLNAAEIVSRVGPLVARAGFHFQYIRSARDLWELNAGTYGYTHIGKCFVIDLHKIDRAFLEALKAELAQYRDQSPEVPCAKPFGDGLPLYYRYGSYAGLRLRAGTQSIEDDRRAPLPPGKKDRIAPFTTPVPENPAVRSFLLRYPVFRALRKQGKCGVFLGLNLESEAFQQVVLKIGHHRGQVQFDGSDGCTFLRRELAFYRELARRKLADLAPALIGALDEPRKVILALEHVPGASLLKRHLDGQLIVDQLEQCWAILGRLHAAGLYVGDAKAGNFLAGDDGRIRILDFETSGVVGVPPPDMRTFIIDPSPKDPRVADLAHFLVSLLYPYEEKGRIWEHRFVDVRALLGLEAHSESSGWALDKLRALMPAIAA